MLYLPPFSLSLQLGLSSLFLYLPLSSSVIPMCFPPYLLYPNQPIFPYHTTSSVSTFISVSYSTSPLSYSLPLSPSLPPPLPPSSLPYPPPFLLHSPTDPGLWSSASHGQRDDQLHGNEVLACSGDHAQLDAL